MHRSQTHFHSHSHSQRGLGRGRLDSEVPTSASGSSGRATTATTSNLKRVRVAPNPDSPVDDRDREHEQRDEGGLETGNEGEDEKGDPEDELEQRIDRAYALLRERGGLPGEVTRDVLRGVVFALEKGGKEKGKGKGKRESKEKDRVLLACEMLGRQRDRGEENLRERERAYATLEEARRELEDAQREMRGLGEFSYPVLS